MSDAEADMRSETAISNKLRDIVIAIHKSGNTDELTVKRVRVRAEKELGLDEGFFKTDPSWKRKSQEEIVAAVDTYCHADPTPQSTPKKAAPKPKAKPVAKKPKATSESARGAKRKAAVPSKQPAKRRKASSDEESEADMSDVSAAISAQDSDSPKKLARRARNVVTEDSDGEEEAPKSVPRPRPTVDEDEDEDEDESDAEPAAPVKKTQQGGDILDSDLSSVIDEGPIKKQRKKKDSSTPAKKESKPKPAKAKGEEDPDQARIKELQGWLVKCGIRKVWSKDPELSKCNTAKEKISVLKVMLTDVGMDGKFSVEKAAKIKEQREFAKDLEAIKEGELAWGKTAEVTSTGRPSRRAAARAAPIQKIVLEDDSDEDMDGGDQQDGASSDEEEDDDVKPDSDDEDDPNDGSEADDSE